MSTYVGTGILTRQALRRDRVISPIWVAIVALLVYASASAVPTLYHTAAERIHAAEAINNNPAVVALYGRILDVNSVGELAMTKMTVLYAIFVAILMVILVRRHTRVEEESGRLELVGGTAVGRDAPLTSAVVEAVILSVIIGLVAALANIAGGLPAAGSIAFGAMWTGLGIVTAAITLLACQFSASARTCAAIAAGAIGVLYVLRAVGDTSAHWVSWLSPFGWNTQFRAWSQPRWWMLLLYIGSAAVLIAVAQLLRSRRDLGSGLLAARPGRATGSPRLADAITLSLRVHSGAIIMWSVACAALGIVFGAIAPGISNLLDSPNAAQLIARLGGPGALADTLVAAVFSLVAVVITCFAISVIGHTGGDEADGRTEAVLATATSRSRWFAATALIAFGGILWLLFLLGFFLWLGYGVAGVPAGAHTARIIPGALAWAPAAWLVASIAMALFAFRRSWTAIGWALPAIALVLTLVGELLKWPDWLTGISPYAHVPQMPSAEFVLRPELVMTGIAVVVLAAAWWRFTRRDIG
jgi:ABC-2 type transport system permease protein